MSTASGECAANSDYIEVIPRLAASDLPSLRPVVQGVADFQALAHTRIRGYLMRMHGRTIHTPPTPMRTPRDPLTRLALLCRDGHHSTPLRRERLATQTLVLACAVALDMCRRGWLRICDADSVATDASAWCLGGGLRKFDPSIARWSTFVSLAVRREARWIAVDEARQAKLRREARRIASEEGR